MLSGLYSRENEIDKDSNYSFGILYIMLVHEDYDLVKRIIEALNEPQHVFIIHVDNKVQCQKLYDSLIDYKQQGNISNIYILPREYRVSLNWGGFSIVNATLLGMQYAWNNGLQFDYCINLSGSTYPLKSNEEIIQQLKSSNAVYIQAQPLPLKPHPELWNHYVECDNRLHRVTRMSLPRGLNLYMGIHIYTSITIMTLR
jgi:hypothetical protein